MYVDEDFLQNAFGAEEVAALCPSASELATTIELAEATLESALTQGGYAAAVPSTVYAAIGDVPKQIKLAAYGAWLELAHLRKRKELDPVLRATFTSKVTEIREGTYVIPGVARVVTRGPGGTMATETSADVSESDGSRPPVFTRESMEGY